jgi:hypothetical protein
MQLFQLRITLLQTLVHMVLNINGEITTDLRTDVQVRRYGMGVVMQLHHQELQR